MIKFKGLILFSTTALVLGLSSSSIDSMQPDKILPNNYLTMDRVKQAQVVGQAHAKLREKSAQGDALAKRALESSGADLKKAVEYYDAVAVGGQGASSGLYPGGHGVTGASSGSGGTLPSDAQIADMDSDELKELYKSALAVLGAAPAAASSSWKRSNYIEAIKELHSKMSAKGSGHGGAVSSAAAAAASPTVPGGKRDFVKEYDELYAALMIETNPRESDKLNQRLGVLEKEAKAAGVPLGEEAAKAQALQEEQEQKQKAKLAREEALRLEKAEDEKAYLKLMADPASVGTFEVLLKLNDDDLYTKQFTHASNTLKIQAYLQDGDKEEVMRSFRHMARKFVEMGKAKSPKEQNELENIINAANLGMTKRGSPAVGATQAPSFPETQETYDAYQKFHYIKNEAEKAYNAWKIEHEKEQKLDLAAFDKFFASLLSAGKSLAPGSIDSLLAMKELEFRQKLMEGVKYVKDEKEVQVITGIVKLIDLAKDVDLLRAMRCKGIRLIALQTEALEAKNASSPNLMTVGESKRLNFILNRVSDRLKALGVPEVTKNGAAKLFEYYSKRISSDPLMKLLLIDSADFPKESISPLKYNQFSFSKNSVLELMAFRYVLTKVRLDLLPKITTELKTMLTEAEAKNKLRESKKDMKEIQWIVEEENTIGQHAPPPVPLTSPVGSAKPLPHVAPPHGAPPPLLVLPPHKAGALPPPPPSHGKPSAGVSSSSSAATAADALWTTVPLTAGTEGAAVETALKGLGVSPTIANEAGNVITKPGLKTRNAKINAISEVLTRRKVIDSPIKFMPYNNAVKDLIKK